MQRKDSINHLALEKTVIKAYCVERVETPLGKSLAREVKPGSFFRKGGDQNGEILCFLSFTFLNHIYYE